MIRRHVFIRSYDLVLKVAYDGIPYFLLYISGLGYIKAFIAKHLKAPNLK